MKIKDLLNSFKGNSDTVGVEVLLCHVLDCSKEALFMNCDQEVSEVQKQDFHGCIRRLHSGEPVAQITNKKEFYGLDFFVDSRVLIPRPETEHLVEEVIDFCNREFVTDAGFSVLDVGTGSGCIAVALAKNLSTADITACDISAEALEVAAINVEKNGVADRISLVQSDLLSGVGGRFDVIVANLPYIGTEKFNFISKEVAEFEPGVALFGGKDGRDIYRNLFMQINDKGMKPKLLLGEFGFSQAEEMQSLLEKSFPNGQITIKKDLASIERIFLVKF